MTTQIAEALQEGLDPLGVAVVIEAKHMCMVMRGVRKPNAVTITSAMKGQFRDNYATRSELLKLLRNGSNV